MFELTVHTEFCAAHAIWIKGERESLHGHNWRVTAIIGGPTLDPDGLLCDFHDVEAALSAILAPWKDRSLNDVAPFAPDGKGRNPTAEHVAQTIAHQLDTHLSDPSKHHPPDARVLSVSVTEAPGCVATFRPHRSAP